MKRRTFLKGLLYGASACFSVPAIGNKIEEELSDNGVVETRKQLITMIAESKSDSIVDLQFSNDKEHWITAATITLIGGGKDGVAIENLFRYYRVTTTGEANVLVYS